MTKTVFEKRKKIAIVIHHERLYSLCIKIFLPLNCNSQCHLTKVKPDLTHSNWMFVLQEGNKTRLSGDCAKLSTETPTHPFRNSR